MRAVGYVSTVKLPPRRGSIISCIPAPSNWNKHYKALLGVLFWYPDPENEIAILFTEWYNPVFNTWKKVKAAMLCESMLGGLACCSQMLYGDFYFKIFFNFLFSSFGL